MTMTEHEITWTDYDTIQNLRYGYITINHDDNEIEAPVKNVDLPDVSGQFDARSVYLELGDVHVEFVDEDRGVVHDMIVSETDEWDTVAQEPIDDADHPREWADDILWEADDGGQ